MAETHQNEMKIWNVPRSWGKWLYLGTIGVLLGVIGILGQLLKEVKKSESACRTELREVSEQEKKRLWDLANQAFDRRYEEKKGELAPNVEEIKAVVDSINNKRL